MITDRPQSALAGFQYFPEIPGYINRLTDILRDIGFAKFREWPLIPAMAGVGTPST